MHIRQEKSTSTAVRSLNTIFALLLFLGMFGLTEKEAAAALPYPSQLVRLPFDGPAQITQGPSVAGCPYAPSHYKGVKWVPTGPNERAIDFGMGEGTPIYAAGEGDIQFEGYEGEVGNSAITIQIRHSDNLVTFYTHLSRSIVNNGDHVYPGTLIGYSGDTGAKGAFHLHFAAVLSEPGSDAWNNSTSVDIRGLPGIEWNPKIEWTADGFIGNCLADGVNGKPDGSAYGSAPTQPSQSTSQSGVPGEVGLSPDNDNPTDRTQAYRDAYVEAVNNGVSPGQPVGRVHDWVGIQLQDFSGGSKGDGWGVIAWDQKNHKAYYIGGGTWQAYKRAVYEESVLGDSILPGYPTSAEVVWAGVPIQFFEGGSWGNGAIVGGDSAWLVTGKHWEKYWEVDGWAHLGRPLGPVYLNSAGKYQQDFEKGIITELNGKVSVDYRSSNGGGGWNVNVQQTVAPAPDPLSPLESASVPTLAPSMTCADNVAVPQMTSRLSASPVDPTTTTEVTLSTTITNNGCGIFSPEVMAIGGRDTSGNVTDPYQSRDFVLGPGESVTINQQVVLTTPGTHEFFMVYLRAGGGWNRIPDTSGDSSSIFVTVSEVSNNDASTTEPPANIGEESPAIAPIEPVDEASDATNIAEPSTTDDESPITTVIEPVDDSSVTAMPSQGSDLINMDIGATGPNGHEIGAQFTVTTGDGVWLGSCVLEGDALAPYLLSCQVPVPRYASVIVTIDTSTTTPGYTPIQNPITFDTSSDPGAASYWGVSFQLEPSLVPQGSSQTSDIAVVTTENGQSIYDACFILLEYGNEGCDRNQDGKITYEDVPLGTYTLHQTQDLGHGRSIPDSTITVTGSADSDGWERKYVSVQSEQLPASPNQPITTNNGTVDIALITRDPMDGHLLTNTCYVLVNFSNEGCDKNGDGQVTFAQVPSGTYTVRQTQTPAGYQAINDYQIYVDSGLGVPLGFLVRQAPEQNSQGKRNISFVFVDSQTNTRVVSGICVELIGASNVGCDRDLQDGQIDFLEVPQGTWPLNFTNVPSGWQISDENSAVFVDAAGGAPTHQFVIINVHVPVADSSNMIAPVSEQSATLRMTFRGCPEGFRPGTDDYFAICTIPLDAPDASFLYHGGDGQGGMNIMGYERQYDGAYIFQAEPYTMNINLSGLAPVVRDSYTVIGHDTQEGQNYGIQLVTGETRDVYVFYYFWP